jgi:undecaprenyl diphosphate synthase
MNIPHHVAIIMDGNGRWAQKRGLPRTAGHKAGGETLKKVLPYLKKRGVKVVTLYAFSSENWERPKDEVDTLIKLFRDYLNNDVNELKKQKTRISFIGDRHKFPDDIVQKMNELELDTENYKEFHVVLALSYGARDDITEAIKQIVGQAVIGMIKGEDITPQLISETLSTHHIPNPDLIIRTSGEQRLSNFLLWEAAYSEFYFPKVYWPDFNETEIDKALEVYTYRNRRFGKV